VCIIHYNVQLHLYFSIQALCDVPCLCAAEAQGFCMHCNRRKSVITYRWLRDDIKYNMVGPRGSAVERQSLASILLPPCAQPVADV